MKNIYIIKKRKLYYESEREREREKKNEKEKNI